MTCYIDSLGDAETINLDRRGDKAAVQVGPAWV
jgi:hypothetical protein